jgi:hypothetical protein
MNPLSIRIDSFFSVGPNKVHVSEFWSKNLTQMTMKKSIFWDMPASNWFLACFTLRSWGWRRYVPPKRWLIFIGLHGIISHKTELFISSSLLLVWNSRDNDVDAYDYCMKQSHYSDIDIRLGSYEIPHLFWKSNVCNRVHNGPLKDPELD